MPWCGILNLNKPSGVTSRRVVDDVERLVRPVKAGHAGTLDPLASGVLVVCVGPAKRLVEFVQRMPKRYRATFLLGRSSPTEDIEGEVTVIPDARRPELAKLREAAAGMFGQIEQRPPAYSALKVAGRRAYSLARAGREVPLQPRVVTVHRLEIVHYAYPELMVDVECGSGTYVRSLGRDLAERVGTAAVMAGLERTAIGRFDLASAVEPAALGPDNLATLLRPAAEAVADLVHLRLTADEVRKIGHGVALEPRAGLGAESEIAALDETGQLVAILMVRPDGRLGPKRVLQSL